MTNVSNVNWKKEFHEALAAGQKQDAARILKENHVLEKYIKTPHSFWKWDTLEKIGSHMSQLLEENEPKTQGDLSKVVDLLAFDIADLGNDNVAIAMVYTSPSSSVLNWDWRGEIAVINLDEGVKDANVTGSLCVRDAERLHPDIVERINRRDILRVENGKATVRLGNFVSASAWINGLDLGDKKAITEEFIGELKKDKKDYKKIQMLIRAGADPNAIVYKMEDGGNGRPWSTSALRTLMDEQHYFNGFVHYYDFPDYKQLSNDAIETIDLLLKHGANTNGTLRGQTPLMCAIERNNVDVIKLLLKYGADIEYTYPAEDYGLTYTATMIDYANHHLGCSYEVRQFIKEELQRRRKAKEEAKMVETPIVKSKENEKVKEVDIFTTLDFATKNANFR